MPSIENIARPITLIGFGRSGTSLLSAMIAAHTEVDFVGETAQPIFWTWLGAEQSQGLVRPTIIADAPVPGELACALAVRGAMLGQFPSDRPRWMHKPIGVPESFWYLKLTSRDCGTWYWKALSSSFPDGHFITILRNPIDVAISARLYWGFETAQIVSQLREMADLVSHPDSRIAHAVNYDHLVTAPEATIKALCADIDLALDTAMLAPLTLQHAPRPAALHQQILDACAELATAPELPQMLAGVADMWRNFGHGPTDFIETSTYVANWNTMPSQPKAETMLVRQSLQRLWRSVSDEWHASRMESARL